MTNFGNSKEKTKFDILRETVEEQYKIYNRNIESMKAPTLKTLDNVFFRLEKVVLFVFQAWLYVNLAYHFLTPWTVRGADLLVVWILASFSGIVGGLAFWFLIFPIILFFVDYIIRGKNKKRLTVWMDISVDIFQEFFLAPMQALFSRIKHWNNLKLFEQDKKNYEEQRFRCERFLLNLKRPDAEELYQNWTLQDVDRMIEFPVKRYQA